MQSGHPMIGTNLGIACRVHGFMQGGIAYGKCHDIHRRRSVAEFFAAVAAHLVTHADAVCGRWK